MKTRSKISTLSMYFLLTIYSWGNKLSITKQSARDIERREKDGSITLKSLRETGSALDMQLVYGLIPKDGTLEKLVEKKAKGEPTWPEKK